MKAKKETLNITLSDWTYECGDGCCHEWGVDIKVNDKKLDSVLFGSVDSIEPVLRTVLEHLGHEVNINIIEDE